MAVSHMYPTIDFTLLDYAKIPIGAYLVGFDSSNGGKLCKMDHFGNITVIESGGIPIAVKDEGFIITGSTSALNFVGTGVTATQVGANTNIVIPGPLPSTGLNYQGTWDATLNSPHLASGVGTAGDFYIVQVAGTTNLDGITDWQVGDWAIFEAGAWQKIDNHDIQAYNTIQEEGVSVPQRSILNFKGLGVNVVDNAGKTEVTFLEGIPATSYGLYAQYANSTPIAATTTEGSLIGPGYGTLSVPANGFFQGGSFRADLGGLLSSRNNDTLRIRIKSGSVILADSGAQTMPNITNDVWQCSINFTIRQVGAAGVASIVTLGVFHDVKTVNGVQGGFAWNFVNSTTFDTTVINTLNVTAQWSSNSASNSIYSDIFVLNKIY